jgi:malate dehydrogenase
MGIVSDGSYGVAKGIFYSFPVTVKDGKIDIVQGLTLNDFSKQKMQLTEAELKEEADIMNLL